MLSDRHDAIANEGIVIDLSAIIRSLAPLTEGLCNNFSEFAGLVLNHIEGLGKNSARIDIVADLYYKDSIKGPTRRDRGSSGPRFLFSGNSSLPSDFVNDFLRNGDNKTDFNLFVATEAQNKRWNKDVFITRGRTVVNCINGDVCSMYEDDNLTLEEADNRIVCHISHMIEKGLCDIRV